MKLEMKQRIEQVTNPQTLLAEARASNAKPEDWFFEFAAPLLRAIDALLAERDSALDDHARRYNEMLVSEQENQRLRAERDAHHSERERDLSNFTKTIDALRAEREVLQANLKGWHDASDAQTDNNTLLRDKLAKATEALTKLADKWERRECMTDAYQLAANELRAALDAIKETTNG